MTKYYFMLFIGIIFLSFMPGCGEPLFFDEEDNNSNGGNNEPVSADNGGYETDHGYEQPDEDIIAAWQGSWSALASDVMSWHEAKVYCASIGGRLPTINELRSIITNCLGSMTGGACQVSDPVCLSYNDCRSDDCKCDGSAASYSVFGDENIWLWSSSELSDIPGYAWFVDFSYGHVGRSPKDDVSYVRCIR